MNDYIIEVYKHSDSDSFGFRLFTFVDHEEVAYGSKYPNPAMATVAAAMEIQKRDSAN